MSLKGLHLQCAIAKRQSHISALTADPLCRYKEGKSLEDAPLVMHEEYVKPPPPDYVPPTGQKCALAPLPEGYPAPALRVQLCHFRIAIALCHTDSEQGKDVHACLDFMNPKPCFSCFHFFSFPM